MHKKKIKSIIIATMLFAGTAFGFTSCDTGTSPGETNVERSEIREEGAMVVPDGDRTKADQDSLEKYYDHADHENHDNNSGGAVHAGDGKKHNPKQGIKRNKVDQ